MNINKKTISLIIFLALLIILLILIKTNAIYGFDISIYNMIASNMNEGLTNFFKLMSFLGGTLVLSSICFFALFLGIIIKKRNVGFAIFGSTFFSWLVSEVVKNIVQRPRPEILRLVYETSYSFPSGHTASTVTFCGMLIYLISRSGLNRTLKIALTIALAIFPVLVAASRIYLGVHYPSDVIGGALIALILLLIEIIIIEKKELL